MSEYSIRLAKPHCNNCHKSKKQVEETIVSKSNDLSLVSRLQQALQKANQPKEEEGEI